LDNWANSLDESSEDDRIVLSSSPRSRRDSSSHAKCCKPLGRVIIGRMNRPPMAQILILTDDETTSQRWATMLCDQESRIWLSAEDVPDSARLDLILIGPDVSGQCRTGAPHPAPVSGEEATLGGPGVVRIAAEGPADVHLPADVTERELRLACRLLAEVVRLRRKDLARTETHRRLAEEALTDPLTGVANRRAWDRALRERTAAAADSFGRLCLAVLDLDHFKHVNDTHGHAAGDAVLQAAGRAISGGLRENDFVARLGGDEFGLLLGVTDEVTARAVVERVRRELPVGLARDGAVVITASAGFCVTPAGDPPSPLPSPDALFVAADAALHQAKREGRDRTATASPRASGR
ncbi:MAG: GGDEF domain-containing protein, partial [Planctomycetota bacterium]